jgi:hypothetical protein
MPTVFKQAVNTDIGTEPVDVLQVPLGVRATVVGCNVANTTDFDTVTVDVYVIDEFSVQGVYVKALPIPPNTSVKIITNGEKLILPPSAGIRIVCDQDNSVDSTISYVEIS